MAWYQDKGILMNSSSGGAFTAIAEVVLNDGGVVFGAYYNEETWDLRHKVVTTFEELNDLRKSKYYQSAIGNVYDECKRYLVDGKTVLFSGTACQIAGLYQYLGEKYENLITVDVLCHGVASKAAVKRYGKSKAKKARKQLLSIVFRVKGDLPWHRGGGTTMKLKFKDGTSTVIANDVDTFYVAFNKNLILRPSCYECPYAGIERISDFTLSDYWGVDASCVSEENLENGLSVVVVNTDKARKLLSRVTPDFIYGPIDPQERAIPNNLAFFRPQPRNEKRESFFKKYRSSDFDRLVFRLNWKYFFKLLVKRLLGPKGVYMAKNIVRKLSGGGYKSFQLGISCFLISAATLKRFRDDTFCMEVAI